MDQDPWLPEASSQLIAPAMSSAYLLVSLACSLLSSPPQSSNCTAQYAARSLGWHHYCRWEPWTVRIIDSLHQLQMHLEGNGSYNTTVLSKQISVSVRSTITMSVSKISRPSCSRQNTAHRWSSEKEKAQWKCEKSSKKISQRCSVISHILGPIYVGVSHSD